MICVLVTLFLYFLIGFVILSIYAKKIAKRYVVSEEFIFDIVFWPIVLVIIIFSCLERIIDKTVTKKLNEYLYWLQKDKK